MSETGNPLQSLSTSAQHFAAEIQAAQFDGDPRAGLFAALCFHAAGLGHSCLQLSRINDAFPELIDTINADELRQLFSGNALTCVIDSPMDSIESGLLVVFGERLYLKKFWHMETALVALLHKRLDMRTFPASGDFAQDLAVLCQHKRLVLLTGGPGTGKTTAMSAAVAQWLHRFEKAQGRTGRVLLCAPTGKAAARLSMAWQHHSPALTIDLSEAQQRILPTQASTLHRVLGFVGRGQNESRLDVDLMVVDEASMIDLPLMLRLLKALPDSAHLLLIGDPNQLPSIEIGNVLGALLDAELQTPFGARVNAAHRQLQFNHRQAASPGLTALAEAIQHNTPEQVHSKLSQDGFIGVNIKAHNAQTQNAVIDRHANFHRLLGELATPELALEQLHQLILLTPLRHGPWGCVHFNDQIARRAGHHGNRHGQAILITKNVPALGLSNGDIGVIWNDGQHESAFFRNNASLYSLPLIQLPDYEPAYALTIHKAQGSEYQQVDLLLPESPNKIVSKALLYTAVTRASSALHLCAEATVLLSGLDHDIRRMNGLMAIAAISEIENTTDYFGSTN